MTEHTTKRRGARVGLQVKSVLVLTFLVVSVTLSGGWGYFVTARHHLRDSDKRHALRLAESVNMNVRAALISGDEQAVQRLVGETLSRNRLRYIAVLDGEGRLVGSASRDGSAGYWEGMVNIPVTVSHTTQASPDVLTITDPVVEVSGGGSGRLLGGVRMVVDTSDTRVALAAVQQNILLLAIVIVLGATPLGFLMVWRLLVQPIRKLVTTARRLAAGERDARANLGRNDEIGDLGGAFDRMADELIAANASLEQKIAARTEELRYANARLRDQMTENEEFVRAVSHDLNAPLRNIAGMATLTLMKWHEQLPEEVVSRMQRIQANVDAETALINELLELSRIRTRPETRRTVDMNEIMAALADTFEYELRQRGIELRIDPDMPRLHVEPSRVRKVFQNLLDNAVKYMHREDGGRIEIAYRRADAHHMFSISDNGPGISPEDQKKVFCVFRRASTASSSGVEGKGVGLALVRSVVANYDGRAWVESQVGRGTTFHVTFSERLTTAARGRPESYINETEPEHTEKHPVG